MIDYGKQPSDQMELELPGLTSSGYELMEEARKWAGRHYEEFRYFKQLGHGNGPQSPNFAIQAMRRRYKVSVPNALSAPLARIAMEEDPGCSFRVARSKTDGFTTANLKGGGICSGSR